MAGAAKVFRPGDVVFKAGDKPDGMYIVRKGELQVFLDKEGKQVVLATIPAGGIVGEMALFDKQNRSASVKASKPSEATLITNADFEGLIKQIPKWFVTLMSALSSRLRQTNERLQKAEAGGGQPMQAGLRLIAVTDLAWAKHGEKDEKGKVVINRKKLESVLVETLQESESRVQAFLKVLADNGILVPAADGMKQAAWSMPNRAFVTHFPQFLSEFRKGNPPHPCLTADALSILKTAAALAPNNPYDPATVTFSQILNELKAPPEKTGTLKKELEIFSSTGKSCQLIKTSEGETLKLVKADIARLLNYHVILTQLTNQSF